MSIDIKAVYPDINPDDRIVFIGLDPRETMAYMVAKHSIEKRSPKVKVLPLYAKSLRQAGLYTRSMLVNGITGQFTDTREQRPHSVEFSFTRFLVPHIARMLGVKGWVIFADCDFLFRFDINTLFDELENNAKDSPLALVKHDFKPTTEVKMDGVLQRPYNMKLWSAFMCFNTQHTGLDSLTPAFVNEATGMQLHQFEWLYNSDKGTSIDSIYGLPENYQFIPGHSINSNNYIRAIGPLIIHYTERAPWFSGEMRITPNAEEWWDEVEEMKRTIVSTPKYTRFWE